MCKISLFPLKGKSSKTEPLLFCENAPGRVVIKVTLLYKPGHDLKWIAGQLSDGIIIVTKCFWCMQSGYIKGISLSLFFV